MSFFCVRPSYGARFFHLVRPSKVRRTYAFLLMQVSEYVAFPLFAVRRPLAKTCSRPGHFCPLRLFRFTLLLAPPISDL